MKLHKSLSALTFILLLFYMSLKGKLNESILVQWSLLGFILLVAISAFFVKHKDGSIKKSKIIFTGVTILGSIILAFYFL
ncbi:hypothetical protein SAMN06295967_10361 [Belliella buryatensis]|uniref:DUF3953 domain-containing protein n=1 Tax=Belliella buryatensis TaxID=1500549 RepID=A0A239BMQ4_9BACT|nr:hypothetical protein SAMN06295967_10361 [Belliella buryatensis]